MQISPTRRRRAMRVHYLRQQGMSPRSIAKQFDLSEATVRADLKLVETHWGAIAAAAADDLLLESLQLLNYRLVLALENKAIAHYAKRLNPVEYLRAQDAHQTQLTHLAREVRRTAQAVHQRAAQRPDQPELYESDDEDAQNLAKDTPKSSKTLHPETAISSPEREIVENPPPEEKIPENTIHPAQPDPQEAIIQEVLTTFPHLKGQSNQQILQFLDQFTAPNANGTEAPTPIYAEAAG